MVRPAAERATDAAAERLLQSLYRIRDEALAAENAQAEALSHIDGCYLPSARNFIHYLAVRKRDIREIQQQLQSLGLSSLGVIEPHTMASLNHVIAALERISDRSPSMPAPEPVDLRTGPGSLTAHAADLLGPGSANTAVRIMVTMPSEAATEPKLVENLLCAGMNVMRINCAHDSPDAWIAMVENLRAAQIRTGLSCRIQADLAGPKVRTGPVRSIGRVRKYRPSRDAFGRVVRPARLLVTSHPGAEPDPGLDLLPVSEDGMTKLAMGDELRFTDARESKRRMTIKARTDTGWIAELVKTAYVTTRMTLQIFRDGEQAGEIEVGELPEVSGEIRLGVGDELILTREAEDGTPAPRDDQNRPIAPARIHCTLSAAFDVVGEGEPVWFDDGKIGGVVRSNDGEEMRIEVTHASPRGSRLRAEKGINFPGADFDVAALTDKDVEDLEHVVPYVDMVALSCLRRPEDVVALEDQLTRLDAQHIGVVIKIENRQAFENLPRILLVALRSPPVGVMVARGDLAVEVGFDRLCEVQEEMLWLCEAAHVPVIWATQVLENLAKKGSPSRAEVTDAAASQRAECVMLNKGAYIVEATRFLSKVLSRMESHNRKRRATLRKLAIADCV
jgi:pyruvate kinase